jgi:hypothetical protein
MFERQFTTTTVGRLSAETIAKLEGLIDVGDPDGDAADGGDVGGRRAFLQEL